MKKSPKRPQEILNSARKAAAKITDPAKRAKATAKLDAAQKKLDSNQQRIAKATRQQRRAQERDREFDR